MRVSAIVLVLMSALCASAQEERILGKTGTEWLQILREHKEPRFRRAALIALEAIGPNRQVLSGLYEALEKDPEPQVRRETAQLLGRIGPDAKGAAIVLATALQKDPAAEVRAAAATALGGKLAEDAKPYVPALAAALKDKDVGTRVAAAEALKNLGEQAKGALPELTALARDPTADRHARLYALQAISRWGREESATAPALVEILNDRQAPAGVREAAAEGLGRLRCTTADCVAALGRAVGEKAADLRLAAAAALTALGPAARDAWPAIKAGLKDGDSGLRYQLIRAAGALAKEQPEAVAQLAELAQSDEAPENRLAAVQELGEAGPAARSAEPVLARLASQDARARLREAAAAALKKIAKR